MFLLRVALLCCTLLCSALLCPHVANQYRRTECRAAVFSCRCPTRQMQRRLLCFLNRRRLLPSLRAEFQQHRGSIDGLEAVHSRVSIHTEDSQAAGNPGRLGYRAPYVEPDACEIAAGIGRPLKPGAKPDFVVDGSANPTPQKMGIVISQRRTAPGIHRRSRASTYNDHVEAASAYQEAGAAAPDLPDSGGVSVVRLASRLKHNLMAYKAPGAGKAAPRSKAQKSRQNKAAVRPGGRAGGETPSQAVPETDPANVAEISAALHNSHRCASWCSSGSLWLGDGVSVT